MVVVAQLVRALDCDSRGRRFEPDHPPNRKRQIQYEFVSFLFLLFNIYEVIIICCDSLNAAFDYILTC